MAAGAIEFFGSQIAVPNSDCADVVMGLNAHFNIWNWNLAVDGCSASPVIAGVTLPYHDKATNARGTYHVVSITATPSSYSIDRVSILEQGFTSNTSNLSALTAQVNASLNSPFNLSSAEGGLIGTLIVGVWAVAWAFKAAKRAMDMSPE
jgi:hypothetical protein